MIKFYQTCILKELIDAIKAENVNRVKELVQAGCDINVEEPVRYLNVLQTLFL